MFGFKINSFGIQALIAAVCGFLGGYCCNKIGRQKTLTLGGVISLLANVVLITSKNLPMVYIGRMLVGCAVAIQTVTGLIYIGEITSPHIRGIILTCMGVFHGLGSLLVYSVGPFLSYAGVGYVLIPLNVLFIGFTWFLPESPMFYVIQNDEASARTAFQNLGRDTDINNELQIMMEKTRELQRKQLWKELFTVKSNQISLFITISLTLFQNCSGIIAVIFFGTTIFRDSGSSVRPDISTIIVGATFVLGACVSPLVIEKYGRRMLLLVSTAGCCASMTALGLYFYLKLIEYTYFSRLGWVPLTSMVFAIFIFSIGLSIIPNTLIGELFTSNVRGLGAAISTSSGWMTGFLSTTIFGYAVVILGGHVTFWIYAVINALAFCFVVTFVPETKGKTLMEIQTMIDGRKGKQCADKEIE